MLILHTPSTPAGASLKHLSIDWPDDLQLSQWLGTLTALEVGASLGILVGVGAAVSGLPECCSWVPVGAALCL